MNNLSVQTVSGGIGEFFTPGSIQPNLGAIFNIITRSLAAVDLFMVGRDLNGNPVHDIRDASTVEVGKVTLSDANIVALDAADRSEIVKIVGSKPNGRKAYKLSQIDGNGAAQNAFSDPEKLVRGSILTQLLTGAVNDTRFLVPSTNSGQLLISQDKAKAVYALADLATTPASKTITFDQTGGANTQLGLFSAGAVPLETIDIFYSDFNDVKTALEASANVVSVTGDISAVVVTLVDNVDSAELDGNAVAVTTVAGASTGGNVLLTDIFNPGAVEVTLSTSSSDFLE